jgi:hypothetical protein
MAEFIQKLKRVEAYCVQEDWWEYDETGTLVPSRNAHCSNLCEVVRGERTVRIGELTAVPGEWFLVDNLGKARVLSHDEFWNEFQPFGRPEQAGKAEEQQCTEDYVLAKFAEANQEEGEDWKKWAWLLERRWPQKYGQ